MKDLASLLKNEKIQNLRLLFPLMVFPSTPLSDVLSQMKMEKTGKVIVLHENSKKIAGIFTERDALTRVLEKEIDLSTPVEKVMTPNPTVLQETHSLAEAIRLMNQGRYRHIPLVDDQGELKGVLDVRDLIHYLAENFPHEIYNLPPDPHQVARAPEGA